MNGLTTIPILRITTLCHLHHHGLFVICHKRVFADRNCRQTQISLLHILTQGPILLIGALVYSTKFVSVDGQVGNASCQHFIHLLLRRDHLHPLELQHASVFGLLHVCRRHLEVNHTVSRHHTHLVQRLRPIHEKPASKVVAPQKVGHTLARLHADRHTLHFGIIMIRIISIVHRDKAHALATVLVRLPLLKCVKHCLHLGLAIPICL